MISIDEISLCIINRNGVRWLPYSLGRLADKVGEIVFVDTGSKDESLAVAERLGARIFQIEWNDDFSHPRNVGLCHSRCNWILSLDSDEIVHLKDLESVLNQVDRDRLVGYRAIVRHYVSETESPEWIACQPDLHLPVPVRGYRISRNVKLFPNLPNIRYRFPVHETVAPDLLECGISIHDIDLPIHHIGFVGLSESELREKIIRNFRLGLKKLYEYPNIGQSYQELGELILNYGDPKVAIRLFQRAVEISPGSVKSCLLLADSYLRIGLPRDAQHILLALRTRFPENLDIKERLGRIAYELGEFDAVELYLAGTERYFSLVYLALARLHQSKYHEAFRAAASAVKINPYGSEGRIVFLRLALKLSEEKKETVVERDNL